jgi:hypothetical protein
MASIRVRGTYTTASMENNLAYVLANASFLSTYHQHFFKGILCYDIM